MHLQKISSATIFARVIFTNRLLFITILRRGVGYFDSGGLCTEDYETKTKNEQKSSGRVGSARFQLVRRLLECVGGPRDVSVALAVQGKQLYVQLALFGVHSGQGPTPMKILTPLPSFLLVLFLRSTELLRAPRASFADTDQVPGDQRVSLVLLFSMFAALVERGTVRR